MNTVYTFKFHADQNCNIAQTEKKNFHCTMTQVPERLRGLLEAFGKVAPQTHIYIVASQS